MDQMDFDRFLHGLGMKKVDVVDFYKMLGDRLHLEGKIPAALERANSIIGVEGNLRISQIDERGSSVLWQHHNLVTNGGFRILVAMWGEPDSPETFNTLKPTYIAIGDDNTAADVTDDALYNEQLRRPFDQRVFLGSPAVNGVQFEMVVPKSVGNTGGPYAEAGIFPNSLAETNLIARQVYTAIPKNSSFQLSYQWSFIFSAV